MPRLRDAGLQDSGDLLWLPRHIPAVADKLGQAGPGVGGWGPCLDLPRARLEEAGAQAP